MPIRWTLMVIAILAAGSSNAQQRIDCDDEGWGWGQNGGRFCEVRELTVALEGTLAVDAGANGSISVTGASRRDAHVRARIQAWDADDAEAERIASEITVRADDGLRAEGPERMHRRGWSVSYEVLVPRETNLALETNNGSISVANVGGDLELEAHNGSINIDGVAGNVRGRTTNGGVDARLTGDAWEGAGLDLKTTNGGVRLRVPENYSARLETSTVNGGVDIDFPVTVEGRIGRQVSTTLGKGGALVRAATTNGQVRVSRSSENLRRVQ